MTAQQGSSCNRGVCQKRRSLRLTLRPSPYSSSSRCVAMMTSAVKGLSLYPPPTPHLPKIFVLSHWTAGPRPLDIFLWAFPLRALSGVVQAVLVYSLPDRTLDPWTATTVPWSVGALIFLTSNAHGVIQTAMFMSQISFFTRVAALNPISGGATMTFLNTMANLGGMWVAPLALLSIEGLTVRACQLTVTGAAAAAPDAAPPAPSLCHDTTEGGKAACAAAGGACVPTTDGFALMMAISTLYCLGWWIIMRSTVRRLQDKPPSAWLVAGATTT